jgi:putative DNA primase/helicase
LTQTANTPEVEIEYDKFGFVKGYGCPQCGSKVFFDHKDDVGTHFYKCEKCGEVSAKLKVLERTKLENNLKKEPTRELQEGGLLKNCEVCRFYLNMEECPLIEGKTIQEALKIYKQQNWTVCHDFEQLDISRFFNENGKFIPKLLAEAIMNQHYFLTMMDNQDLFVYVGGFYQPYGEIFIKKRCKDLLLDEYRKNRAGEVIEYIKVSTLTGRREEPPNLVPLENGILDLDTMELKPYSPDLMFFNKIPVKYNPEATCPKIDKFHSEITNGEEDIKILVEMIGFCLYRDYFIAKALMLVGGGANGKSTWLSLVKRFLGPENVSGRSLQDLEEHRFAKADLHTKLANIYADLPDKALHRTGMFKMSTGRDIITAERKFGQPFNFVSYDKLFYSANKVPEVYDDTTAFFRRWIIQVFPNEFIGANADPHILEKLTTEEELSGLLNKALAALKRLLEKGQFSYSKTTEEIREDYIRKSSPIAAFVMDCLEVDSDAFIEKKALYNEFAEYCRGRSLPTVVRDTFFKNLPQHAVVSDFRPKIEGKGRLYSFKGLRYKANGWSNQSKRSRVFFTLIEKKDEYEAPYITTEFGDKSYIKVCLTLDRLDRLDRKQETQKTELEKLEEIEKWILENQKDGVIVASELTSKITEQGFDFQKILGKLRAEGLIFEVSQLNAFGVAKP